MEFPRVALGLGSNLGDRLEHLRLGVRGLAERGLGVCAVSSVYASEPEGFRDQPEFLNAVVTGRWDASPMELLAAGRALEAESGRVRSFLNAPRTLDVDVLLIGAQRHRTPELVVPHPRWKTRAFVLAPLAEVAGDWRDPASAATVESIWSRLAPTLAGVRVVAPPRSLWSPT